MAVLTVHLSHRAGSTITPPAYFIADTFVELSSLGVEGDLGYAKDTDFLYVYTTAGWDSVILSLSSAALLGSANVFSSINNEFQQILKVDKGLKFPATQVADSDVNTLDDYEEGTFSPIIGGSGGESGQTYAVQIGKYIKIGRLVHVSGYVLFSNKGTITGSAQLKGLPFAVQNTTNYYAGGSLGWWSFLTNKVWVVLELAFGTTAATLYAIAAATTSPAVMVAADISSGGGFEFSATYVTDN